MSESTKVQLTDLTDQRFPDRVEQRGTFLQRAGVGLFYWVLAAATATLLALVVYLFFETPSFPQNAKASASWLSVIAEQRTAVFDNFLRAVEKIIVGIFLPILTAILGYVLGTRETASAPDEDVS